MKHSVELTEADIKTAIQHYVARHFGYDVEKVGTVVMQLSLIHI